MQGENKQESLCKNLQPSDFLEPSRLEKIINILSSSEQTSLFISEEKERLKIMLKEVILLLAEKKPLYQRWVLDEGYKKRVMRVF